MSMPMLMAMNGFNFEGSGNYSGDIFTLGSKIASKGLDFSFDGTTFLSNVNTRVESEIAMDLNTFRFTINSLDGALNELPLTADGFIQINDENMEFDLFNHPSIDREELLIHLEDCIDNLKEEQQRSIHLFYLKQLCYNEIVEQTGYALKKVKSYIQNGKRNLKICIESKSE